VPNDLTTDTQRCHGADETGDDEAPHHARPGLLRSSGSEHENAGADNRPNAQQGQLNWPQRAMQRFLLGSGKNGVQRFDATEHGVPLAGDRRHSRPPGIICH
jgi:hypothetical protein